MIVTSELDVFERATFKVRAVRITADNIREIADWTGAEIVERKNKYLLVPCGAKKETRTAYAGDWVTCLISEVPAEPNFRVYGHRTFLQAFPKRELGEAEKYAKVHEHLLRVAQAQDKATYFGDTSDEVLLLIDKTAHELCKIV